MAMTFENIRNAITEKTKAIVLVHVLGFDAISNDILELCDKKNIMIIEDCCESHGATHDGHKVGTFGDMSNFSFYFGHHMTTIEGGMVCTNDDDLYDYMRLFRSHGMTRECSDSLKKRYEKNYPDLNPLFTFAVPGFNMRNTEMNAIIGLNQIKRLDKNIECRVENLNIWLDSLDKNRFFVEFKREGNSNFSLPLVLKEKNHKLWNDIQDLLVLEKVEYRTGTAGGGNQVRQPYLLEGKYSYRVMGNLMNTDHIHEFGLYIGNHCDVDHVEIKRLCSALNGL